MTARRAIDADLSPALALLFFVPVANYVVMLALCFAEPGVRRGFRAERPVASPALDASLGWAVAAPPVLGIAVLAAALGTGAGGGYAYGMFLGAPFAMGFVSAFLYDRRRRHAFWASAAVVQLGVVVTAGFFLLGGSRGPCAWPWPIPWRARWPFSAAPWVRRWPAPAALRPRGSPWSSCWPRP